MSNHTGIEWTDATWNPWQGCTKVSDGCKFCYMYSEKKRYGQNPAICIQSMPPTFNAPLSPKNYRLGSKVFTCSWSDWFIEAADEWRDDAWAIIRARPDLTFQILTKRPERILSHLPNDWRDGYQNVWLGVSVENQMAADERIPLLSAIPARIRFLSVEPMLGPVDIGNAACDWVICGGESGPNARPMQADWARSLRDQCVAGDVAFFFKQWGGKNKKAAGRLLDGREHNGMPV